MRITIRGASVHRGSQGRPPPNCRCNSYRIIFKLEIALLIRLFLKRDMLLITSISILTHFNIAILINYIDLSIENNFIFKLVANYLVVLFVFLVNFFFYIILARNNLNILIKLSRKLQINIVINLNIDKYYYVDNQENTQKLVV